MFTSSYNMAPSTEDITKLKFVHAKQTLKWMDIYFHANEIDDCIRKITHALDNADNEFKAWFIRLNENENKPTDRWTWRKFKNAVNKKCNEDFPINLLKARQETNESNKSYVQRMTNFLQHQTIKINDGKQIIRAATNSIKNGALIERTIKDCKDYYDLEKAIKNIDESIKVIPIKTYNKGKVYKKVEIKNKQKDQGANSNKPLQINEIKISNTITNENIKTGKLINEEFIFILDPGSDINVIDETLIKEKNLIIANEGITEVENTIFGKKTIQNIQTIATITIDDIVLTTNFLATKTTDPKTILLGRKTINEIKEKKEALNYLMNKYPGVFDQKPNKGYRNFECEIETPIGKKINIKNRRIPQALLEGTEKTIKKLLENKYIEPSTSSWANPLRPVVKPNGEVRVTCNMQFLNNIVQNNNYTVPNIQEIINKTQGNKLFTIIDLADGYYQINLRKEDRFKTAFYFNNRLYQWTRMPQGFKNSPAIFQMIMDNILKDEINKCCNVYLDDIIVYGKNEIEHDKNLEAVIKRLNENNLKINVKKLQYKQEEVKLLGSLINGKTQRPISEKQQKIIDFQTPMTQKELQRFLGFANYYRKYINHYAMIAAPLYDSIKGADQTLIWNNEKQTAFDQLKKEISSNILIHLPDFNYEFILTTDASNSGIGAVLKQFINDEEKIIDWASKKLTSSEEKYGITEKEFLAMAWAIEHYEYYLKGRKFTVITDHQAILAMKNKPIYGSLRLERMRERLQAFDFEIIYKKGETITDADTLSRLNEEHPKYADNEIKSKKIIINSNGEAYWKLSETEIRKLPEIIKRIEIIKDAHEKVCHRGVEATSYEIKKEFYWPNMNDSVSNYIKNCDNCVKNTQKTLGGEVFVSTSENLEKMGIDLIMLNQQKPMLTFIDYFTRLVRVKILKSKEKQEIGKELSNIFKELGNGKMLISDNGKEFVNKEVERLLNKINCEQHFTSMEKHQSNGRIERVHRTLWQSIRKLNTLNKNEKEIKKDIYKIVESYNNTKHRGIGMTPNEAWNLEDKECLIKANNNSKYLKEFKKLKREEFKVNDNVYIRRPSIELQSKKYNLYDKKGTIVKVLDNDSYLIKNEEGKIFKRNHYSLRKILNIHIQDQKKNDHNAILGGDVVI